GYNKRQRQKLQFRNTRDARMTREVFGDDNVIGDYFGEAYTKKGKKSGKTHGMGKKNHRFVNMYSYDADDFSFVRYVDPLTGYTLDEHPLTDMRLVMEQLFKARAQAINDDELDTQTIRLKPGIEAYFQKGATKEAIKIDLMPHNPLQVCNKGTIAGFPEREFELRQTGKPIILPASAIPKAKPFEEDTVHE
nr:NIa-VPg [Panax virus Y]